MKALLVGRHGQLAVELRRRAPAGVDLCVFSSTELDITDDTAVAECVRRVAPDVVVNAAAYTAVDLAESEPDAAMAVNRDGVASLARAASRCGAFLLHVSTDFVFPGDIPRPLRPDDPVAPLGAYGKSKAAGEQAVLAAMPGNSLIVRTSWLYSATGSNFVKTMLRLARERDRVAVVCDQVGSPTWAGGLADALWRAVERGITGIHHYADAGVASWYDLAVAVMEEAFRLGIIKKMPEVAPIATADYPTPARRPAYSVLDTSGFYRELGTSPSHWRVSLRKMLVELRETE